MDFSTAILLVVKVDRHSRGFDSDPRLSMSDVINIAAMPTFYKIMIPSELVRAVESGERPEQETIVHAYRFEVPRRGRYETVGQPLHYPVML